MLGLFIKFSLLIFGLVLLAPSAEKIDRYGFNYGANLFAKTDAQTVPPIYVLVSAIWQGQNIRSHNVAAMQRFRRKYGGIPFTHFVSPAYFLRKDDQATRTAMIQSTMTIRDQVGMVLHPYHSVTAKAGVIYRSQPSFWGTEYDDQPCRIDCGHDVPLAVYPESDVNRMIAVGRGVLAAHGYDDLQSFMAGGWMASNQVLSAAAAQKFKFDYSAVPQHLVREKLEHYPLYKWLGNVWQHTTPYSQPYKIDTPSGTITEIGNSAAIIDYLSVSQVADLFDTYLAKKRANPAEALTFHIAFHQETALKYLPRLEEALDYIFEKSARAEIAVRPIVLPVRN